MSLLVCPNCKVGMVSVVRHGVEIDVCPECQGVWLDAQELDRLLAAARTSAPTAEPALAEAPRFLPREPGFSSPLPPAAPTPFIPGAPAAPQNPAWGAPAGRHDDHDDDHGHDDDRYRQRRSHDHDDERQRPGSRSWFNVFD